LNGQSICLVHLARAANGIEPLRSFLASYRAHAAGVSHALLIVFKGYREPLGDEYECALNGVPHERHFVPDAGYDIDVYFSVARNFSHPIFCFLNSYSVILVHDWLLKLSRALSLDGVGMVGATGSWQSIFSNFSDEVAIPRSVRSDYPAWKRILLRWFPFLRKVRPYITRWTLGAQFDPFPNYHLRTNAFMLSREIALKIRLAPTRKKFDAYRFESGRHGMTAQVRAMGKRVLVVARDGTVYDMNDWYQSNTFWRSNQENLMVADNQTRKYDGLDRDGRLLFSSYAWGPKADPGLT